MRRLVVRRLALLLPTVWLVASLTFVIVLLAPGDYADTLDNPRLTAEARADIRARYGLDRPIAEQYLRWLGAIATGDLGSSFFFKRPVRDVLADALPPTLLLTGAALALDLVLGFAVALAAARRPHGWVDRVTGLLSLVVYGMPSFWIAGGAVLLLSVIAGWFPPSHLHSVGASALPPGARLLDLLHHLVLPACCLGLVGAASTARFLRASLLEIRHARYVVAARARGLSERRILWVHALRPALLPVVTLVGLSLPFLVGGSVVIESVFSWPGVGLVLLQAAAARDLPVIMALTVLGATAVVLGNLVADVLYAVVDPRAREDG